MRAMKRRHFFRQAAGLALLPLAGTLLGGCEKDPNSGPVDVKWDRQVCERCSMILSDTRYAAQIRDPDLIYPGQIFDVPESEASESEENEEETQQ